ncbi:hypothetical protein ACHAXS_006498 [Conticribra weissflogii]
MTQDVKPFRIRTITAFAILHPSDFPHAEREDQENDPLAQKIDQCSTLLREAESRLSKAGYEIQTVRIATNPFGEWLTLKHDASTNHSTSTSEDYSNHPATKRAKLSSPLNEDEVDESVISDRLQKLNNLLSQHDIGFCSLGPSTSPHHTISICPKIVSIAPGRFSCSANVDACDVESARAAAKCVHIISTLGTENDAHLAGGLGNFRFCAASCVASGVPFFPAARGHSLSEKDTTSSTIGFGIGLENGEFALNLLKEAKTINAIDTVFATRMKEELLPIQEVCSQLASEFVESKKISMEYLGIDTSLNPSLDESGSIAAAIETLEEVRGDLGQCGSLSAAAAITVSLQSVPGIVKTGYCGLMLPVLEDRRLAELGMISNDGSSSSSKLTIQKLLYISSVCGVGIDTVPIPGNVSLDDLSSLILDVAALAGRWRKPLSCRVFPVPGKKAGDKTTFDSPYMCNSCIFEVK